MRYHYEKPDLYFNQYGKTYECDHPAYWRCTLYKMGDKGLAVIQQRLDIFTKSTTWSEIDPWLVDDIYLHPNFRDYFDKHSKTADNGLYPTVTVRQIMWALKMKPMKKEPWETTFDHMPV